MAYKIKELELADQPTPIICTVLAVEKLPQFFGEAFGHIVKHR